MLKRQEMVDVTVDILKNALHTDAGVFGMCDENFDALSPMKHDPRTKSIKAINVKCLQQRGTNDATASHDGHMIDTVTLQIIIFYASNHADWSKTLNEMCAAVQWTLEFGQDDRFRKFGQIMARNTQIDDGTGNKSMIREGGALIEYEIDVEETPDATWKPAFDKFKKLSNEIQVSDSEKIQQTTTLPGNNKNKGE